MILFVRDANLRVRRLSAKMLRQPWAIVAPPGEWFAIRNQINFFMAGLHNAFEVRYSTSGGLRLPRSLTRLQAVVIDSRSKAGKNPAAIPSRLRRSSVPLVLLHAPANVENLPSDEVLSAFDVVFKREPWRDRERYARSAANLAKIHPTMISCPLMSHNDAEVSEPQWVRDLRNAYAPAHGTPKDYDVSFLGKNTARSRITDCMELHRAEDLRRFIGLYFFRKNLEKIETSPEAYEALATGKRSEREYAELIASTKVNPALEGFGQFTYRHLEVLCLGGFMLSKPVIDEIELPGVRQQSGTHYAVYDTPQDLVEKTRYYAAHDDEREQIAEAGRRLFETLYDPAAHGRGIKAAIKGNSQ